MNECVHDHSNGGIPGHGQDSLPAGTFGAQEWVPNAPLEQGPTTASIRPVLGEADGMPAAGMGLTHADTAFVRDTLEERSAAGELVLLLNTAGDPVIELGTGEGAAARGFRLSCPRSTRARVLGIPHNASSV